MNISEIGDTTLKIAISKSPENEDGIDFEECLFKAMYIYPPPHNTNIKTVDEHAKQIYDSELIERSVCNVWPEFFKPLTYKNVQKYFEGEAYDLLMSGKKRTVTKNRMRKNNGAWESYDEVKHVYEYEYMFNDLFHIPSLMILECKVYKNGKGRLDHIQNIVRSRKRYKSADYFLLAHDKSDIEFDITDCISVTQQGYVRYHDFREFFNCPLKP